MSDKIKSLMRSAPLKRVSGKANEVFNGELVATIGQALNKVIDRVNTLINVVCELSCRLDALESKAEAEKPPNETKRYAQVGDYVKIIKSTSPMNRFEVGKVYRVTQLLSELGWSIPGCVILECGEPYAKPSEYVVLEGYKKEIM